MFKNNKYTKWYNNIISNRKQNLLNESIYQEKHQDPLMLGKIHNEETISKLREANQKQFEDPTQIELRKKITKEQRKDPKRSFKAGNGKIGKSWYHCPNTKKCLTFFPDSVSVGYIKGRIIKK